MPTTRVPGWLRQRLAAVRDLLVLTVLSGLAYPLTITGFVQVPGLQSHADGSPVTAGGPTMDLSLLAAGSPAGRRSEEVIEA